MYEEEEEDSVVDKDELSEEVIEEAESKDQVYNCDISDQKHVKPNLTDELPSSYSQDQKSDKIAHTRNISELKRELDCLQPIYVPYRRTSARNARPMSCDADVALSGAATNIRLSNSDGELFLNFDFGLSLVIYFMRFKNSLEDFVGQIITKRERPKSAPHVRLKIRWRSLSMA